MPETPAARNGLTTLQKTLGLLPTSPADRDVFEDVCFVCVDCEAFEHDQSKITEIGVSVLDTRELTGTEPGHDGDNWVTRIQSAHFRITEHATLVNRRFVKGREEHFNFGNTVWITEHDAEVLLRRLFASPGDLRNIADFALTLEDEKRSVILVGHGLSNDRAFLNAINFSVDKVSNIVKNMDTETIAGSTKAKKVALGRLLVSLGVSATNLHNGGNDAAYTLQALIRCAVKDYVERGSVFGSLDSLPRGKVKFVNDDAKAANVVGGTAIDSMIPSFLTRVGTAAPTNYLPKDNSSTLPKRRWRQRRRRNRSAAKNASRDPAKQKP